MHTYLKTRLSAGNLKDSTSVIALAKKRKARGISLLEGVLYLALALSLLGFAASFISDQQEIQENIQTSSLLRDLTDAGQLYMSGEYDDIREDLIGGVAAPASTVLEELVPLTDIADLGYFPGTLLPGDQIQDIFGQNYAILVRGVNANDGATPQATLTRGDVVDGTGAIDPLMIDGNPANGEYELEAVLVSYGDTPVPQRRGGPITNGTGRSTTGFLPEQFPGDPDSFESFGPRGGFQFDLTGFADDILVGEGVPFFPQPEGGRFASLLALSNYGALTAGGLVPGEDGNTDGVFLRCEEILATAGLNQNSAEYRACLNNNQVYDEIVFNNDFNPAFLSAIRDVDVVAFTNDGTGAIDNLASINCGTPSALPTSIDNLRINCGVSVGDFNTALIPGFGVGDVGITGTARVNNALRVDGFTSLGGNATVEGNATFDQAATLSSVNGGQDIREGIYRSYRQGSDTTIPKPTCPAGFLPNILTSVAFYSDPQGRGSVGVGSFTEDEGADWRLRMVMFLDEDICDNGALGPYLDPTISPAANGCGGGDGAADIYEVPASNGMVTAQTQCVAP
ncbi:hypothetical protein [Pseudosulfitobacter pseudonitzschiae]|uniref:hypothetical protein n=1 Tax=Pseudosulfitobacter pseudonitzschiae TaxID=1402135 RepID=UPI003B7E3FF0